MPACLGTMMVPFGHETSYVKIQAPMADGRDQDRLATGGIKLPGIGASEGPGQTGQNKGEQLNMTYNVIRAKSFQSFN